MHISMLYYEGNLGNFNLLIYGEAFRIYYSVHSYTIQQYRNLYKQRLNTAWKRNIIKNRQISSDLKII